MVAQPFGEGNELLAQISAGMVVIDAAGERIGTVRRVYLGAADLNEATLVEDPALAAVPDAVPNAPAVVARLGGRGRPPPALARPGRAASWRRSCKLSRAIVAEAAR